jgi:phosphatidylglycerophosphatase A
VWVPLLWTGLSTTLLFTLTLLAAVAATLVGIPVASAVAREAGIADPGFVVIDEAAGTWTALLAACLPVPWLASSGWHARLPAAVAALVLFRVFDIWKPWPVSALDRMHGGAGIMLDDLAAGGYAFLCVLAMRAAHWLR